MSPNGRRAWRKWMRRVEHDPNLRPQGKSISRLAREGKRHLGSIPPTPAKPFTARSLVGMTMGARKRLYRYIVDALPTEGDVFLICAEDEGVPIGWFLAQRLRPCPGCEECRGYDDGIGVIHCDGSGVLPARKETP